MAVRECRGVYQQRFECLWAALAMCDSNSAGELSARIASGIIGCSEKYAARLIDRKLKRVWREFDS